jgi:ubiquinone/menaquinone biosynthesis C-methylase UbiE
VAASDKEFTGSIPEFYDTYLVPLIFESYAEDLAKRVVRLSPKNLLETAAGSGVVPRALAPLLDPDANYVVSDLNLPMLDHAAAKQGTNDRIKWQQADAQNLPFDSSFFDVVFCQYGVMFYPDRVKGYTEAYRVLEDDGSYIFSVWDKIEENEFADIVTQTAAKVFPDDPPRFLPRTPHGYHDFATIKDELAVAGFSSVSIDTVAEVSRAPSPRHPAIAYCQGTPLRNEIESRNANLLDQVTNLAAQAITKSYGVGPVEAKIQAHIVTAVK